MAEVDPKRAHAIILGLIDHGTFWFMSTATRGVQDDFTDKKKSLISNPLLVETVGRLADQEDIAGKKRFAELLWDLAEECQFVVS